MKWFGCAPLLAVLAVMPIAASAAEEGPCFGETTSADIAKCLARELRGAEKLLSMKQSQLLDRIAKIQESPIPLGTVAEYRLKYSTAVKTAEKQWRALMSTECGTLVPSEFDGAGAGSMALVVELNCKVDRVYKRIKHLSESEGYRYLWSQ